MSKQDRQSVRSAADLERKYDLAGMKKAVKQNEIGLNKINKTQEEFANNVVKKFSEVQNEMDNVVATWYYNGVPTLKNEPASMWAVEEYASHVGDQYYDRDTGYAYVFELTEDGYSWKWTRDKDIAEALALANSAKDTADGKRRIFLEQPAPPYDRGDLWLKDKELYVCQIAKVKDEEYETADFIIATKYTDDAAVLELGAKLEKNYSTTTEMETIMLAKIKANNEEFSATMKKTYVSTDTYSGLEKTVGEVESQAKQTAEKFNWIVKSGESSADFEITDRMAELTATYINLNGLVQFEGLASDLEEFIIAASDDAKAANDTIANWCSENDKTLIDGGKIYTESITSKQINVKDLFAQTIEATGSITGMQFNSSGTDSGGVPSDMTLDGGRLNLECIEDDIYIFTANIEGHHSTYAYKVNTDGGVYNFLTFNGNYINLVSYPNGITGEDITVFSASAMNNLVSCSNLSVGGSMIQTSDARKKENIIPIGASAVMTLDLVEETEQIDIHSELFDRLQPVQYNLIGGDGRVFYGLIAQDVASAMQELGFAEDDLDLVHHHYWTDEETGEEKESYGLAYTNLIPLLIREVQKLKIEIAGLAAS